MQPLMARGEIARRVLTDGIDSMPARASPGEPRVVDVIVSPFKTGASD
jgi:hypothetical protein